MKEGTVNPPQQALTHLLRAWSGGDVVAGDRVLEVLYDDLRQRAASYMRRERGGHTLQPTALVHETFLRLEAQGRVEWQDRNHFLGVAALTMRRILVEYARAHAAQKRGGSACRVALDESVAATAPRDVDLLDLDAALSELTSRDPRAGRLVEMRFFGGLSIEEVGKVLGLSAATVKRDWALARAWLFHRIAEVR
jgi:RNA polymerase sigma factor (TIGR02999 family)